MSDIKEEARMAEPSLKSSRSPGLGNLNAGTLLLGVVCFGVLVLLLVQIGLQLVNPPPGHRLVIEQDVPLPSALPDNFVPHVNPANIQKNESPLTPGVSIPTD